MTYQRILMISLLLVFSIADDEIQEPTADAVSLNVVAEGFTSPVFLTESPDNSGRLFVVEQFGQIYILKDGQKVTDPFLDIQNKLVPREGPQDDSKFRKVLSEWQKRTPTAIHEISFINDARRVSSKKY